MIYLQQKRNNSQPSGRKPTTKDLSCEIRVIDGFFPLSLLYNNSTPGREKIARQLPLALVVR